MKKRALSLLLALCLCLGLLPTISLAAETVETSAPAQETAAQTEEPEPSESAAAPTPTVAPTETPKPVETPEPAKTSKDFEDYYFMDHEGALYQYNGPGGHVVIPEHFTEIGTGARHPFENNKDITGVELPSCLTKIHSYAFSGCTNLTDVTFPDGLTDIDGYAFRNCSSLTSVDLPDSLTSLGSGAFSNCYGLTRVTLPKGLTTIRAETFAHCEQLTEIVIPEGVTSIESRAFSGCSSLTNVVLPDSLTGIAGYAFEGCTNLTQVDLPNSAYGSCKMSKMVFPTNTTLTLRGDPFTIEDGVLKCCKSLGGNVVIPNTVKSIGTGALFELSIERLTFPDTVTELGDEIAMNCSIKEVVIPASVTKISSRAFVGGAGSESLGWPTYGLTIHGAAGSFAETWANGHGHTFVADQSWSVAQEATKHNFVIENGVLKGYTGPGGDLVVPDGVTKLDYNVFDGVGTLNSLTLPAGIKSVSISNPYVKHITVGDGTETVSLNCPALESLSLPDSLTSRPYLYCPELRKLTLPKDSWAFKGISRADFMAYIKNCPMLETIVNCPNEFVDDLIAPNAALRDNWTDPKSTIVAQPDRIVELSNEITAGLTTDYDKAKAISQWVVDHIKYDDDYYYAGLKDYSDVPFDPQEILDKGQAVCAGFSRLTQALLVAQKIPCLYVLGNTSAGYHAWNLALIDGEYLWIDSTWGMFGLGVYAISRDHEATGAASFNNVKGPGTLVSGQDVTQTQGQTEEEQRVRAAIEALKADYPEGMRWTNSNSYTSKALSTSGYGCAGFAYLCSDAAFGDAPITGTHSDFDKIRVGDILRINNNTHSVVVLEKRESSVIVTEGNYNSSIHWGREITKADLEKGNFTATTRWGAEQQQVGLEGVSNWAAEEVAAAVRAELVPQDIQNSYTVSITRQDFCRLMVQLVEKSSGKDIQDYLNDKGLTVTMPFTDTANDQVLAAYALGIVKGTSETTFNPAGSITRQEAATMLARTAKLLGATPSGQEKQFQDSASVASWAKEGVALVTRLAAPQTGHTVMEGTGEDYFSPLATYSREQAILTAYRLYLNVAGAGEK